MNETLKAVERWQLNVKTVRDQMYRAPTARERERWHAIWLMARGWTAAEVAEALERDAHTIGTWAEGFREQGPKALALEQSGGSPPPSTQRNRRN